MTVLSTIARSRTVAALASPHGVDHYLVAGQPDVGGARGARPRRRACTARPTPPAPRSPR